jgi:glycosyltransferase involved in cell wall biosynthesis
MKIALVHDWLIHMRGGEKVLEALAELYPDATIYTLFYRRKKLSPALQRMKIQASFLQYFPGITKYYRWLLPLLPYVIRTLEIREADLVISSSHCVAKAVKIPEGAIHICYCHTPMRYLWGFEEVYFEKFPLILRPFIKQILARLRAWDLQGNSGVNEFLCNSEYVRDRIRNYYGREALVVYPPLDTELFQPIADLRGDYYLVVSAFVPYKRIDLVIEAFNSLERQLVIVGDGPLAAAYRKLRKSDRISFLGQVSSEDLRRLYARSRALIFPTEEDFGIVPLEAQACGTPVIAFRRGGALESVRTGIFFEEQTPESIRQAVSKFEGMHFDLAITASKVAEFNKTNFKKKISATLEQCLKSGKPAFSYAPS